MNSPKNNSSAWRYFVAGLKPYRNFTFWGTLSALAIIAGVGWLYWTNPQWLTPISGQPDGVNDVLGENGDDPSNPDIGLEMPLQSISQDAQTQQQINPNSNLGSTENPNQTSTTTGNDPFNQLTGKSENKDKKDNKDAETDSIFLPLLPNVKNPSSLVTNNNSQQQNNNTKTTQQSTIDGTIDGLVKPKPVTVSGNPLQSAIDREFAKNSNSTTNTTTVQTQQPSQTQSNISSQQDRNNSGDRSQQTNNDLSNQTNDRSLTRDYQPLYNPPTQNNFNQPSSVQTSQYPYLNSPVQPNYNQSTQTQQQNQSYQSPYGNNPVQPSVQNQQNYQSPYLNTPIPQVPPVTQTQYNQPNYGGNNNNNMVNKTNNIQVPQYQQTIEDSGFDY